MFVSDLSPHMKESWTQVGSEATTYSLDSKRTACCAVVFVDAMMVLLGSVLFPNLRYSLS